MIMVMTCSHIHIKYCANKALICIPDGPKSASHIVTICNCWNNRRLPTFV